MWLYTICYIVLFGAKFNNLYSCWIELLYGFSPLYFSVTAHTDECCWLWKRVIATGLKSILCLNKACVFIPHSVYRARARVHTYICPGYLSFYKTCSVVWEDCGWHRWPLEGHGISDILSFSSQFLLWNVCIPFWDKRWSGSLAWQPKPMLRSLFCSTYNCIMYIFNFKKSNL